MVVCVLFIACLIKITTCNPCLSSLATNKYPTMTTSYATSISPGDNSDFIWDIPLNSGFTYPDMPLDIAYPSEEIKLNYQNLLSRPMAITPLPISIDLRTDAYNPEINIPNDYSAFNGYTPRIGASQTNSNFLDHPIFPRLANDIQTPKYQCKPFSESFNSFRDNIYKANELNFRNVASPFSTFENSKGFNEINYSDICDVYNYQSSPLKIRQENYSESPICKPSFNYNNINSKYKFDGQENIINKHDIAAEKEHTNNTFFNPGTSTPDNGPSYKKLNPFNSNILNQQLLLNNQILQEKKLTKPDEDNLNIVNIDINIPNNNFDGKKNPIKITIIETDDDIIDEDTEEEESCIIIDVYDTNINSIHNNNISQQLEKHNTSMDLIKQTSHELDVTNTIDCTKAVINSQSTKALPPFDLKEFSSYLAETILSALQPFIIQENSSDTNDCYSDNLLNFIRKGANDSNNLLSSNEPFISSQHPEVCPHVDRNSHILLNETKSHLTTKNTIKESTVPSKLNDSHETPQQPMPANSVSEKYPTINIHYIFPEKSTQTLLPLNSTDNANKLLSTNSKDNKPESYSTNSTINIPVPYANNSTDNKPKTSSTNSTDNKLETSSANITDIKPYDPSSTNGTDKNPETHSISSTVNKPESSSVNSIDNKIRSPSFNSTDSKTEPKLSDSTNNKPETSNNTENKPETSSANIIDIKPYDTSSTNSTDKNPETYSISSTDNKTDPTLYNSRNNKPETTNSTENISETSSANNTNNNFYKISESSPNSSTQIYVMTDGTSSLDNNIDKVSLSETRSQSKSQPRLSTITINISPIQENNHQILVFV